MKERKRIFIVAKTYPTISAKYAELVCTAGVLEDGTWIRLYPVPFRKLDFEQKYKKYTWINMDVKKNTGDFRPKTYRPAAINTLEIESERKLGGKTPWKQRKEIIFKNKKIYTNLSELIDKSRIDGTSLAIFKPTRIIGFSIEASERNWDENKLEKLKEESLQLNLFQTPEEIEKEFQVVKKVPYKFYYKFEDDSGKVSRMMIEDWEIGMLYFNCLWGAKFNEKEAIAKVKEKYFDEFVSKRDVYFFMGTTKAFHNVGKNPFMIIGVFYPPKDEDEQLSLL